MTQDFDFDAVVVGAGAVGLACGYALSQRGLIVAVLEAEHHIGQGVSSRNSEVIHGGLYYPTGSLKAQLCVQGRRLLYAFLDKHGVAYKRCGKLVVATSDDEIPRLDAIWDQALANDVEGMERLSGAQAQAMEPGLNAHAALLSPQSGVFASHDYMLALQGEIEAAGGAVVLDTPFEGAEALPGGGFTVRAGGADPTSLTCRLLITAPGLSSQEVASRIEGYPADHIPKAHYGKGVYFRLTGKAPFQRLIYPPPIHGALGTPTATTWAARRCSGRTWNMCPRPTIRSTRAGPTLSPPISASSGRACPTARWFPTTPACDPSCMARMSRSLTSSCGAWRIMGSRG